MAEAANFVSVHWHPVHGRAATKWPHPCCHAALHVDAALCLLLHLSMMCFPALPSRVGSTKGDQLLPLAEPLAMCWEGKTLPPLPVVFNTV